MCEAGSYCEGVGGRTQCPMHSASKAGSKTRSDCACSQGYWGSLAEPSAECQRVPLAMHCADEGCNCSEGWEPIYNVSGDGVTVTMQCVLECALGEYAVIDEQSFAKVCSPSFLEEKAN